MIQIRSEQDKKLVGHIKKKSKRKRINVYFNKTPSTGKTRYLQGTFHSNKNDEDFAYKSSYELAYLQKLENDENVIRFIYEPFELPYVDSYNKERKYIPDFMVLYKDSTVKVTEIKPQAMLKDYDVQAKAKAAMKYIEENYKDLNMSYEFVTEKQLFNGDKGYLNFLKEVKNNGTAGWE